MEKSDKERMEQDMKYVIDSETYEKHIRDEVHLYSLLHQLAFLAGKVKDAEDMANLVETAKDYGEIAEEKFDDWLIPGLYLVFGDRKDLAELKAAELTPLTAVLKEHDAKIREKQRAVTAHDPAYIISGSAFRMLVGNLFDLLAQYGYLRNRVLDVKRSGSLHGCKRIFPASIRRAAGCTAGGVSRTARLSRASICWKAPFAGRI